MISAKAFLSGKKAAVFDFDGTLADTIGLWNMVDVKLAQELGAANADPEALHAFREQSLARHRKEENPYQSYCADFGKWIGSLLTGKEIHARRYSISRRMLREKVSLRSGAAQTLLRLKAMGLRLAVATTTRRANIEIYCTGNERIRREIHLADVFECFVCAEDVRCIKPDPECYCTALKRLGVNPNEAFAVEDTLAGVQAARGAGLECIGIYEPHSAAFAAEIKARTACYFQSYADFLRWLAQAGCCSANPA